MDPRHLCAKKVRLCGQVRSGQVRLGLVRLGGKLMALLAKQGQNVARRQARSVPECGKKAGIRRASIAPPHLYYY